jgi:hypothetical protein
MRGNCQTAAQGPEAENWLVFKTIDVTLNSAPTASANIPAQPAALTRAAKPPVQNRFDEPYDPVTKLDSTM